MIQFYAPDLEATHRLAESDSGHAVRVLRMREGDELFAVDGRGNSFRCRILLAHPKHLEVEILEKRAETKCWQGSITLAVAPTKNLDRIEWMLEKCVEIGIDRFVPVLCSRSERKVAKEERLERIMVSAMKQSLKATLPQLDGMTPLAQFAEEVSKLPGQKFVGYCSDEVERRELAREYTPGGDAVLLIGPEGDFSPAEIEMLLAKGFIPVTFGRQRLRTETAALYAVTALHVVQTLS